MPDSGPVLVALDGSPESERALPYAAAYAHGVGAEMLLASVIEEQDHDLRAVLPAVAKDLHESARTRLTAYLEEAAGRAGVPARMEVRSGHAAEEIAAWATESGARTLAMATHGRSGIGRWIYGSTAGRLLRIAPCPILAVGPHVTASDESAVGYRHIMVPLDGSAIAEEAMAIAGDLARRFSAKLTVTRVVPWISQSDPITPFNPQTVGMDEAVDDAARDYLAECTAKLSLPPEAVEAFVLRGSAASELIDFIEQQSVDLVVMTTHARKGLARAVVGSVAERMLQSHAPVLLIHPTGARKE